MTELEIRTMLAEGFVSSGIYTLRNNGWTDGFLDGSREIEFSEVEMDSLAAKELCMAIEVNVGVSVLPEELVRMAGLSDLVARISAALYD
jgi:hypothetical protein